VIQLGGFTLELGLLSLPLTLLWFMGFMNTSNFMDGMDGLSGGMSLIALGGLLISGGAQNSVFGPAVLVLALMVAVYLAFNMSTRRKVFLGDSGSLTLGMSVGILGILLAKPAAGAGTALSWHPLAIVLAAYSVGIADVAVSIIRRARRGASIFKADSHHFHHRLLRAGLDWKWTLAALHGLAGLVVFAVSVPRYGGVWALIQFLVPSSAVVGAGVRLLKVGLVKQSVVLPMDKPDGSHLSVAPDEQPEALRAKGGR
jgi:UDP-GlcNAc:undecaprenyl-phosphate GlcNAc-1-phosphate transferase